MGRSPCCEKAHTNKGVWTKEEDEQLISHIKANGEGCWRSLPKAAGLLRCGKSCRLRWINYLRPDLKRGNFSLEEDQIIIKLQALFGNKWSLIAGKLPGRTDNEIKNYWNTHIRKRLASQAATHSTTGSSGDGAERSLGGVAKVDEKIVNDNVLGGCKNMMENPNEEEEEPNLELQIRPPFHDSALEMNRRRKGPCFYCSLGVQNSKDCSCYGSGR